MKIELRADGRVELVCAHGVGHPSPRLTELRGKPWQAVDGVHGCDGCCRKKKFAACERSLAGEISAKKRRL